MNKVYKAFDSIKIDEEFKHKAFIRIGYENYASSKLKIFKLMYKIISMACILLFIIFITNNIDRNYVKENEYENNGLFHITENNNDKILYKGNIYLLDLNYNINDIKEGKKIGIVNEIDINSALENDFDSYSNGGFYVYSSEKEEILIVKSDVETHIYKR